MKIRDLVLRNYGSYKYLQFDYSNLGLTLVSGSTKAGKSTLLDACGWVMFGVTSKDLGADDVKSWFADDATTGTITVELPNKTLSITRIRGKRATQNDLFYYVMEAGKSNPTRGKDITDTQKLICQELGIGPDLYFAASYLHQFTSDKFFTAKSKERRESMEKIADMSLAITLGQRASESRKEIKRDLEFKYQAKAKIEGQLSTLNLTLEDQKESKVKWAERHKLELQEACAKHETYESDKEEKVFKLVEQLEQLDKMIQTEESFKKRQDQLRQQIKALEPLALELKEVNDSIIRDETEYKSYKKEFDKHAELKGQCPTCLAPLNTAVREEHLAEIADTMAGISHNVLALKDRADTLTETLKVLPILQDKFQKITLEQLENKRLVQKFQSTQAQAIALKGEINPYGAQIDSIKTRINPYTEEMKKTKEKLILAESNHIDITKEIEELEHKVTSLTWLYDKSYELRGMFLRRSVKQINDTTNRILEKYFDATIRVAFSLPDSDKLEVTITNEGYEAKYAQLSGGERCMLKLAFSIGYMQAAENTAGIKFHTLMLDEAMNGLDANLKVKAFTLLQELEQRYETIILIDHEESFKQMFSNKFLVTKDGAYSSVSQSV